MFAYSFSVLATLASLTIAHMQLSYPAPFNASNNPHRLTAADPYLQYPYDCCGPGARWTYPCRGYHSLLGTPEGAPTATWSAGSQQNWSVAGIGNHYGGSCQVGFSIDKGETFRVATSYEGNCPHRLNGDGPGGQDFGFTVPADLEVGLQLFGWIWYNREQEFNMNCAAVNITAASPSPASPPSYGPPTTSPAPSAQTYTTANGCICTCPDPARIRTCSCSCPAADHKRDTELARAEELASVETVAFSARPEMFVADDGNGCLTPKTTAELKFPDPGKDVVVADGVYPLELPVGNCSGVGAQSLGG